MRWGLVVLLLAGCRGGGGGGLEDPDAGAVVADGGAQPDGGAAACDAPTPALACPAVDLPFATESEAFEHPETAMTLDGFPEYKDQNLDTLVNPGDPVTVAGRAARGKGLGTRPIADEFVSLWTFSGAGDWIQLGRTRTDEDGRYSFSIDGRFGAGLHPTYAVVEGLGECAIHDVANWPAGTEVLVTDIDETLTTADAELIRQISDPSYDPKERPSARDMIDAWAEKGYKIVYLTARPHDFRQPTRLWLTAHGFPDGPVVSADSLVFGESARAYKGAFLNRVIRDLEWKIVVAYGNAESDIQAYEDAGVDKAITFIIGENAGAGGTQAVQNDGFDAHIAAYVDGQPDAEQPFTDVPFCEAP